MILTLAWKLLLEKIMYRRRSCILTNINFILREYAKKEAKIVAKATQQPKNAAGKENQIKSLWRRPKHHSLLPLFRLLQKPMKSREQKRIKVAY